MTVQPDAHQPSPMQSATALPPAVWSYLARAREALGEAVTTVEPTLRYAAAHMAALRATAALLAVRARPVSRRSQRHQRNAWVLLAQVAPELEEWAMFFAAGAGKRAAAEAGLTRLVTARDADDLLRDAERFLAVIEQTLGVPYQQALPGPAARAS